MKYLTSISILFVACLGCKDRTTDSDNSGFTFTAQTRLSAVTAFAESQNPEVRFTGAFAAEVDDKGRAAEWSYSYADSRASNSMYHYHATLGKVTYDSTSALIIGGSVVTDHWFDSDSALMFAEQHGGAEYRSVHSDCSVSARLTQNLTPNPATIWTIFYTSPSSIARGLMIDANSGALVSQTR